MLVSMESDSSKELHVHYYIMFQQRHLAKSEQKLSILCLDFIHVVSMLQTSHQLATKIWPCILKG